MIFQRRRNWYKWHKWFAWYPVVLQDRLNELYPYEGHWAWLEFVYRFITNTSTEYRRHLQTYD